MGASGGLPVIVVEDPAEFLLASYVAHLRKELRWLHEFVSDPLVIASMPIIAAENREGCSEVVLTEEDQSAQALLLDRANKPLRIRVALRNARWTANDVHTG